MKSPVFKGTSWASYSSRKLCSEMRCGAAAEWCVFQWPFLKSVLSVPPLPFVPRVGSQRARIAVSFVSLLPKGLLPAWWPSDRCQPFVPLLPPPPRQGWLVSAIVPPTACGACTSHDFCTGHSQPMSTARSVNRGEAHLPTGPTQSGHGAQSTGIDATWPPPAPVLASSCWLIRLQPKVMHQRLLLSRR